MEAIIIGTISSIIATIIICIFSQFFDFSSRKRINSQLDLAINSLRQLQESLDYEDYGLLISQVDNLLQIINNIESDIKLATYFPTKKKLIKTLLYNLQRFLEICKNMTVGYSDEQEKKARCKKIKRKYLYTIDSVGYSYLEYSLITIQNLNRSNLLYNSFINMYEVQKLNYSEFEELLDKLMLKINLKSNYHPKYDKINYVFTSNELERFYNKLKKVYKNKKKNFK